MYTKQGHQIQLKGLLPQREGEWVSYGVRLGASARLAVRLMLVRVSKAVGDERREALREDAKRKGEAVSQEHLELAEWTILVSNVPAKRLSVPEALVLMRQRWQIERLFHRWKDDSQINEWRTENRWRILCEMYSKLIADLIVQWVSAAGCWQDPYRSLDKAAQTVRKEALSFLKVLQHEMSWKSCWEPLFRAMQSGCQTAKRRTRPSAAQLLDEGVDWPLMSQGQEYEEVKADPDLFVA